MSVNGEAIENIKSGKYLTISRTWVKNDLISIEFDMRGKLHQRNNYQAITRGPLVLARDSRFGDGFVDELLLVHAGNGAEAGGSSDIWSHSWSIPDNFCALDSTLQRPNQTP